MKIKQTITNFLKIKKVFKRGSQIVFGLAEPYFETEPLFRTTGVNCLGIEARFFFT
jgi:hypothetical protein